MHAQGNHDGPPSRRADAKAAGMSRAPTSAPAPVTTFSTPRGSPTSCATRARASTVSGVFSSGFMTTQLPAARAAPGFHTASSSGKFPGHDARDHADRLAPHRAGRQPRTDDLRARSLERVATCELREPAKTDERRADVQRMRLANGHAALRDLQRHKLVDPARQTGRDRVEDLGPLGRRPRSPGRFGVRAGGRVHAAIGVFDAAPRDRGDSSSLARLTISNRETASTIRRRCTSADASGAPCNRLHRPRACGRLSAVYKHAGSLWGPTMNRPGAWAEQCRHAFTRAGGCAAPRGIANERGPRARAKRREDADRRVH
jgi:hypothetical protein